MASLVKAGNKYYHAQFYDARRRPKRKRFSLKTRRKKTALRLLIRLEDAYALGDFDPWAPSEPEPKRDLSTLGAAVDAYLESCSHLKPETLRKVPEQAPKAMSKKRCRSISTGFD